MNYTTINEKTPKTLQNKPVDKISTVFLLSTQLIDKFFTTYQPVDNQNVDKTRVVDKRRKTIARLNII